jgi:hypothetical protein
MPYTAAEWIDNSLLTLKDVVSRSGPTRKLSNLGDNSTGETSPFRSSGTISRLATRW